MGNKNQGCQTLVKVCANLKPGEKALIISDETTRDIGEAICDVAKRVTSSVNHHIDVMKTNYLHTFVHLAHPNRHDIHLFTCYTSLLKNVIKQK